MAKTLAQIQAQIDKLQEQKEALRAKEVEGVVAKIRAAIDHYGLTAEDLGFAAKRGRKPGSKNALQAPVVAKKGKAKGKAKAIAKAKAPAAAKKPVGVIKFRDDAGNQWTGNGQRPGWFKAAISSGKTAEDLLVMPAS